VILVTRYNNTITVLCNCSLEKDNRIRLGKRKHLLLFIVIITIGACGSQVFSTDDSSDANDMRRVRLTLGQTMKAWRGSRGIALLFL